MSKVILTSIYILTIYYSAAQQMIVDTSFESSECVNDLFQIHHNKYWFSPNNTTPDLFTKCFEKENARKDINICGIPNNFAGIQDAKSGDAYCGILVYEDKTPDLTYSENICTKLKHKLKSNKKYCLSYNISLADYSKFKIENFGVWLINQSLTIDSVSLKYNLFLPANFQTKYIPNLITNVKQVNITSWFNVKSTVIAKGGEDHIIIGSTFPIEYYSNRGKHVLKKYSGIVSGQNIARAYYYIDDVSLIELKEEERCNCEDPDTMQRPLTKNKIVLNIYDSAIGMPFVLKNINFELNKAILFQNSYEELNKLSTYLKSHINYNIELNGHTDSTGKEEDNIKLSIARAKAVADYLIGQGIEKNRIIYHGNGSSKPIADNKTENGKETNRRVEILFK